MQISNNSNRMNAPQFGMALKIKPGAQKYLQDKSAKFLNRLENAGDDMADFKYFDLEVGEKGLRVKHKYYANAYKDPYIDNSRVNPKDFPLRKELHVNTTYDGIIDYVPKDKPHVIPFYFDTNEDAVKAYEAFKSADNLDRNILLTKLLEDKYAHITAEMDEIQAATAIKNNMIGSLMAKFGSELE